MNPYDNIGTTRLSTSVHDRLNRLAVDYQSTADEERIVALRSFVSGANLSGANLSGAQL